MFRRKQKQDDELAYLLVRYPDQNQRDKKQPKSALLEKIHQQHDEDYRLYQTITLHFIGSLLPSPCGFPRPNNKI